MRNILGNSFLFGEFILDDIVIYIFGTYITVKNPNENKPVNKMFHPIS